MKIGIVGCGLNSDYHINFSRSYPGAEIVGIVDKDAQKAKDCAQKYGIPAVFGSINDLVQQKKPDVIHIVTPPKTHAALAKEAITLKCNVLVEKPLALSLSEGKELYDLAEQHGVKLCTMHNHFFDPCFSGVHERVKKGDFGTIMNVESYYGLNTHIPAFRDYPAPNVLPWLYTMPGGVYHDFMAHPLYVMLDYTGKPKEIKVMHRTCGTLPHCIPDELRILIDGEKAFGTLTFSFAAKPHLHFVRIYGTSMMAEVDFNTMVNVMHPLSSLPKAAQKATYNLAESWQLFKSTTSNVVNFVRGKLKPYQGMKVLIHRYYDFLQGKGEIPVTREQALLVLETMDEIWKQVPPKPFDFSPIVPEKPYAFKQKEKVLVTGGTGFLGNRLIQRLIADGYPVRVLARKLSKIDNLKKLGVEIFFGDVADRVSLSEAFSGIDLVIHAAADTAGNAKAGELSTIQGTKNVIELCKQFAVKKLVYISSCSVYGVADYKEGDLVTEESSLERFPELRGHYSLAKLKAEQLITEAMADGQLPVVCLRPGTYFGPGGDIFTPMMGLSAGRKLFAIIGRGDFVLPLVSIDNLVDAIVAVMQKNESNGRIYNIVDNDLPTKKQYVESFMKKLYPKAKYLYIPYTVFYGMVYLQEIMVRLLKRNPFLTRYRLVSSQKKISYDSSRIRNELKWTPPSTMSETYEKVIAYEWNKAAVRN
jgi:nucleoside-diphosphate-sugar epimerase/predicted dehydrogenase